MEFWGSWVGLWHLRNEPAGGRTLPLTLFQINQSTKKEKEKEKRKEKSRDSAKGPLPSHVTQKSGPLGTPLQLLPPSLQSFPLPGHSGKMGTFLGTLASFQHLHLSLSLQILTHDINILKKRDTQNFNLPVSERQLSLKP